MFNLVSCEDNRTIKVTKWESTCSPYLPNTPLINTDLPTKYVDLYFCLPVDIIIYSYASKTLFFINSIDLINGKCSYIFIKVQMKKKCLKYENV